MIFLPTLITDFFLFGYTPSYSAVSSDKCIAKTPLNRKDIRKSTQEILNINKGKY